MADEKLTQLAETTDIDDDSLLYVVKDPLTVPISRKMAWSVFKSTLKTYLDTLYNPIVSAVSAQFWLSGAGGWPSITAGCAQPTQVELATNKVNVKTLDFDASVVEYAEWTFAMPNDYGGGTVTAKFIWMANDTTTNAVVWGLQGRCSADGEALDQAWGTAQEVTDANASTAYQERTSGATAAITLAGTPAANELVQWRAYRLATSGSDTLAVDAKLIGIQITYTRA